MTTRYQVGLVLDADDAGFSAALEKAGGALDRLDRSVVNARSGMDGYSAATGKMEAGTSRAHPALQALAGRISATGTASQSSLNALNSYARATGQSGRAALLTGDQAARMGEQIRASGAAARAAAGAAEQHEAAVRGSDDAMRRASRSGLDLGRVVRAVTTGFAAFQALRIARSIADTGVRVESMVNALNSVSGGASGGAAALAFVREEAERLGLGLEDAAKGFTGIAAATRGTVLEGEQTREIFLGVSESMAVLGRSGFETQRALTAVQQVISKGKVSAEELRGQLGEVLPGAFQIAARAMDTTTEGLSEMLEQGKLLSDDFIPKFARQLRAEFADGIPAATESARAAFNRFSNNVLDLQLAIAEGGFVDALTESASNLAVVMRDPDTADGLARIARGIGDITVFATRNIDVIAALAVGYGAARVATIGYTVATRGAAVATRALNAAIRANPIGLVAGLAATAAAALIDFGDAAAEATGEVEDQGRAIDEVTEKIREQIAAVETLSGVNRAIAAADIETRISVKQADRSGIKQQLDAANADFDVFAEKLRQAEANGALAAANAIRSAMAQPAREVQGLRGQLEAIDQQIAEMQARANELRTPPPVGSPERDLPASAPRQVPEALSERRAEIEQEIADLQRLDRARQISAEFAELVGRQIKAEADARKVIAAAKRDGNELTAQEAAELRALSVELITLRDAQAARARAEREAQQAAEKSERDRARAAEETARNHESAVESIQAQLQGLDPSYDRAVAAARRWRDEALANLDETAVGYEDFAADVERIYALQIRKAQDDDLRQRKDWSAGVERALKDAQAAQEDFAAQSEAIFKKASQGAEDFFVGLVQGKATVTDFVDFVIEEMARLVFTQTIKPGVDAGIAEILGGIGGLFGGGGGNSASSGNLTGEGVDFFDPRILRGLPQIFHGGGVIGRDQAPLRPVPMSFFQNAPRKHGGGLIGPGERAIIAQDGERVLTEVQDANTALSLTAMANGLRAALALAHRSEGAVSAQPQIAIYNNLAGQAEASVSQGANGALRIDFDALSDRIEGRIAGNLSRGRGPLHTGLRAAGVPIGLARPRGAA